jgi:hypothetical protein
MRVKNCTTITESTQLPDLYTHPADPTDLMMSDEDQIPVIEFSADPTHTYLIQASTDIANWTRLGREQIHYPLLPRGDAVKFE